MGNKVNRILVYDNMDGYYDAYFFTEYIEYDKIKNIIVKVKREKAGEWTLDDIRKEIGENFEIKDVVLFDNTGFAPCGTIEVNEI